jgi:hypothetical protein
MTLQERNTDIIGFSVLICLVLVGFKLAGSVISADWSWWLVFAPVWIYLALTGIFAVCTAIYKLSQDFSEPQGSIDENALDINKRF